MSTVHRGEVWLLPLAHMGIVGRVRARVTGGEYAPDATVLYDAAFVDPESPEPYSPTGGWMSWSDPESMFLKKFYADMAKTDRAVQFMSLEEARPLLGVDCPHEARASVSGRNEAP